MTATLLSWNVNEVRAIHKKGFLDWLEQSSPIYKVNLDTILPTA